MPKYMKDARIKKPREKSYEERDIKYHHKTHKKPQTKSNHKHDYEDIIIKESESWLTILTLAKRCRICGRIQKVKMLFTSDIPQEYKDLPIVEEKKC